MNINLNLYKYFYVVAKMNSFSKAAEELLISQPSLSYSVKTLENTLDKKLFVRTNNKLELTNYGKELFDKISPFMKSIEDDNLDNKIVSGNFVLGTRTLFGQNRLPLYLQTISRLYPDVNIVVKYRTMEELKIGLLNNEFDFIIDENCYNDDKIESEKIIFEDYETIFITGKNNKEYFNNKIIDRNFFNDNPLLVSPLNKFVKDFMDLNKNIKTEHVQSLFVGFNKIKKDNRVMISNTLCSPIELETGEFIKLESNIEIPKAHLYVSKLKNNNAFALKEIYNLFSNYSKEDLF